LINITNILLNQQQHYNHNKHQIIIKLKKQQTQKTKTRIKPDRTKSKLQILFQQKKKFEGKDEKERDLKNSYKSVTFTGMEGEFLMIHGMSVEL
jgi:hypothetical protein